MSAPGPSHEILTKVIAIAADITGVPVASLRPDLRLFADLGLDSAGALEFIVGLEDAFDIQIGNDEAAGLQTLAEVAALVERLRPDASDAE
jgi:acyl carrier protein